MMMTVLKDIAGNQVLWICLCAWALAQVLKVLIVLGQEKRIVWSYFITSRGMPSSHASTVCALATAIALTEGPGSVVFTISVVLAIIVMYDAAGVRQSVGQQSAVLNRMIREFKWQKGEIERELREFIGHTPIQVLAGAILGILVAWLWIFISG